MLQYVLRQTDHDNQSKPRSGVASDRGLHCLLLIQHFLRNHKQQNGLVEEKDYGKERRCENFGYHDMYTLLNLSKILHENEILRQSGPDRTSHCIAQRSLVELFML